jgi:uncharacterized protein YjbI with pentapeptide repeats
MSSATTGERDGGSQRPRWRAAVVPRVHVRDGEAALPIEEVIGAIARRGARGLVVLTGPAGGGKTTALWHLRGVLDDDKLGLFDVGAEAAALAEASWRLAILAAEKVDLSWRAAEVLALCPWTPDDQVEYLAATHRQRCAHVLERLKRDDTVGMLLGSPQLLARALDRMAGESHLDSTYEAISQLAWEMFPPGAQRQELASAYAKELGATILNGSSTTLTPEAHRWWRHEAVRRVLAAEWASQELGEGRVPRIVFDHMLGRAMLPQVARAVRGRPAAVECLERLIRDDPQDFAVPMAVSVLLAAYPGWRPPPLVHPLYLRSAVLRQAQWAGVDLRSAALMGTDLTDADLREAKLDGVLAAGVRMAGARLARASMRSAKFQDSVLSGADLSEAFFDGADLLLADLSRAELIGASLNDAVLHQANLQGASVREAKLCRAILTQAKVDQADFSGVDFRGATLRLVDMQGAVWTEASFHSARLLQCNLEGLDLPDADFTAADLSKSLLTATRIPGAKFAAAVLRETGLAEIDWEGADLRSADFTHASFHLGSTRSGLIGSTVPCEGSRTGFYTDDFTEQGFRSPEEIRKASLRGADLRNAKVDKADFYLVDLREAVYTPDQASYFKRCGAILR